MEEKGQITASSQMGTFLKDLAKNTVFQKYVEIGTWKGQGSTKCIGEELLNRNDDSILYTVDIDVGMYEEARHYWDPILALYCRQKIMFFLGVVVGPEGVVSFEECAQFLDFVGTPERKTQYRGWHRGTMHGFENNIYINVIDKLPKEIDVLLLDSGELTSHAEFHNLNDRGNVKVVVLDDINVFKNYKLHNELCKNDNWEMIAHSNIRHGWSAFCHKQHLELLKRKA